MTMGLSWHDDEYLILKQDFKNVLVEYVDYGDVEEVWQDLLNAMIDHGAVDPT